MKFTILHCNINLFQEAIAKLNSKCLKYETETILYDIGEPYEDNDDFWVDVEISGCAPIVEKCQLVGVISKLDDGTNSIQNVPGQEIPIEFRSNKFFCDHCGINRYRKEVVIIKNEDGEYKQLGKTCLKDYLGIDLEILVNKFSWVYDLCKEASEENFGEPVSRVVFPLEFLNYASVCIRKLGYVSSSKAYERDIPSSKETIFSVMFSKDKYTKKLIREKELYVEESDKELAKKALEWALSLEGKNDFEYNIKSVAKQKFVGYKHIGYLSAIIPCYQKHLGLLEEKKNTLPSNWIGQPKERLQDIAKVIFKKEIETLYGVSTIVKFVTIDGNLLTWFASNPPELELQQEYNIKFTVKKHDEYNNQKQTLVNRVKVL